MSKNGKPKTSLLTENFCFQGGPLWCKMKPYFLICDCKKINIFCRKVFREIFYYHYMIENDSNLSPKVAKKFYCEICNYSTCKKFDYEKHLLTDKHKKRENDSKMVENDSNLSPKVADYYKCRCGKIYKYNSGYYRHKKICDYDPDIQSNINKDITDKDLIMMLIKDNSELKNMLIEQQSIMMKVIENGTHNTTNNTTNNTNSHNKAFNLNFFLNETCKDAMNIMDFVDSIKLQLSDLEKMGEVGYVNGISNIITTNLKALDVSLRPVHCMDKKRETIYVKDQDKWEKEDDNKSRLRKAIKRVANKNIRLLPQFREKNPEYKNPASRISDKYDKMVIEVMGGLGNNDIEKEDKIIHNISKNVVVEKYD